MIAALLRAVGQLFIVAAGRVDAWQARDTRTDDEIRAAPRPGDWWQCGCGLWAPVMADLEIHRRRGECPDARFGCVACGQHFGSHHGRRTHELEEHGEAKCSFCDQKIAAALFDKHEFNCDACPF